MIEPLETRIAPATLVNPTTVTYQDIDGDDVTLKLKNPVFDAATIDNVLKFDNGLVDGDNTIKQQLRLIDFTALADPALAAGTDIKLTAKRNAANGGDGSVNVGYINSTGRDLGTVTIAGDLGRVDAGDNDIPNVAIKTLSVQSMGRFGTSTQQPVGNLLSTLKGEVSIFTIRGDFVEANFDTDSSISKLTIGGSIIGGAATDSGEIEASAIGKVTIGGSIIGGGGTGSGRLDAFLGIDAVKVGGSLIGGGGNNSGRIETTSTTIGGDLGPVTIAGNIVGGAGDRSGVVVAVQDLIGITVGGSLIGGAGLYEIAAEKAQIYSKGDMGPVKIGRDVIGGALRESGAIDSEGDIASVTIGGSIIGGAGPESASISAVNCGPIKIGGDVVGAGGESSAQILADQAIAALIIGGSLVGGGGEFSALIEGNSSLGPVKIGRDVIGGVGDDSGELFSEGEMKAVTIGGSVIGGVGKFSGGIFCDNGLMGPVKIGGDVRGGAGEQSASIEANDDLASITIGGSVFSGGGTRSGALMSDETLMKVSIGGSVFGSAASPVQISGRGDANNLLGVGALSIKGGAQFLNVLAGYDDANAQNGDASIGKVTVGGDWIGGNIVAGVLANGEGGFGTLDDTLIAGGGAPIAAIASITIKGQLLGTAGGADAFGFVAEQIGKLKIGAVSYPLTGGVDIFALGATGDFFAREDV